MCLNADATLVVSRQATPQIYEHIRKAIIDDGHPSCLTYFPMYDVDNDTREQIDAIRQVGNPNRTSALLHAAVEDNIQGGVNGFSRDEYPFACTLEGGTDSSVQLVPVAEQNTQGGQIGSLIRNNYLRRGSTIHVTGNPPFNV